MSSTYFHRQFPRRTTFHFPSRFASLSLEAETRTHIQTAIYFLAQNAVQHANHGWEHPDRGSACTFAIMRALSFNIRKLKKDCELLNKSTLNTSKREVSLMESNIHFQQLPNNTTYREDLLKCAYFSSNCGKQRVNI